MAVRGVEHDRDTPISSSCPTTTGARSEIPTAAATINSPLVARDGRNSSSRTVSLRVKIPTSRPWSSSTGAAFTRASSMLRNASRFEMPTGSVTSRCDIS